MIANRYTDGRYLEQVKDWHLGDAPWKAAQVHRMIEKHGLRPRFVCDVGCGAGGILEQLQERLGEGVELCGFDISPQAVEMAKERENAHLKYYREDFLSCSRPTPDLVLLLDVFEHVPDYIGFLDRLRRKVSWIIFHIPLDLCAKEVMKKSGYLMHMRHQYGHLHYFTRETALATLEDTGFEIVDCFYTDDEEMDTDTPSGSIASRMARRARRQLFRLKPEFAVSVFNRFNLLVLARGGAFTGQREQPLELLLQSARTFTSS